MIVQLVIACEVGFWVLLVAGLTSRYVLRMPRVGLTLLLLEPLLEVVLLTATAIDLGRGAEPRAEHGVAALYLGYTVGHGHRTVRWLDGHAAHRFEGRPLVRPPRRGPARARHEARVWLGTLVGGAVAVLLLRLAILYVNDPSRVGTLLEWQAKVCFLVVAHGLFALSYAVWPRRAPEAPADTRPGTVDEGTRR
ncbi:MULTISPECIES: hypothetical protein [unclassified Streptomyces]|uniref:hypothetical protein n=1 Tax=unclassified Streptomyces TaxID=2593676 RepID=UPI0019061328|nr:hypothetical protein [Streptomyces sp. HSG2]